MFTRKELRDMSNEAILRMLKAEKVNTFKFGIFLLRILCLLNLASIQGCHNQFDGHTCKLLLTNPHRRLDIELFHQGYCYSMQTYKQFVFHICDIDIFSTNKTDLQDITDIVYTWLLVEQQLRTLLEHLSWLPVLSGVRVAGTPGY